MTKHSVFGRIGTYLLDKKPVLFIRRMLQYQDNVGDVLSKISNITIWSPKVQHSAFNDDAYFAAKIPNYGMGFWSAFYNLLLKKGPYFPDTD